MVGFLWSLLLYSQSFSCVQLFAILWTAAHKTSLSFTVSLSLLKLVFIGLMMPSDHLILCHPLLLLPSIFPSITVFSSESALRVRWPVLELQLQHQSLFRVDFLWDWLVWSPCSLWLVFFECCLSLLSGLSFLFLEYTAKHLSKVYFWTGNFLSVCTIENVFILLLKLND